jgi:hypothetical protein
MMCATKRHAQKPVHLRMCLVMYVVVIALVRRTCTMLLFLLLYFLCSSVFIFLLFTCFILIIILQNDFLLTTIHHLQNLVLIIYYCLKTKKVVNYSRINNHGTARNNRNEFGIFLFFQKEAWHRRCGRSCRTLAEID